ncbi:hypothetical protein [Streptomyces cacaoi]|uniref:hypothetical protein n=1 Tax=Streptomyces cacaoi TaxID=1898 RepID=UPI0033AEF1C4
MGEWEFIGVTRQLGVMLDWFVRHRPDAAGHTISPIIGEAERQLDVPQAVSINSVKTALALDGALSEPEAYLELVLPPEGRGG